jgi:hypothetical protein
MLPHISDVYVFLKQDLTCTGISLKTKPDREAVSAIAIANKCPTKEQNFTDGARLFVWRQKKKNSEIVKLNLFSVGNKI